jgi:hypothetical protein
MAKVSLVAGDSRKENVIRAMVLIRDEIRAGGEGTDKTQPERT